MKLNLPAVGFSPVALLFASCAPMLMAPSETAADSSVYAMTDVTTPVSDVDYSSLEFIPVEPRELHSINRLAGGETLEVKRVKLADLKKEEMRKLLGLSDTISSVERFETDGKLGYVGSTLSGEAGTYRVRICHIRYTPITISNQEKSKHLPVVQALRLGVGVEIDAVVTTKKSGLNIGSIPGLEAAMNRKSASGTIKVRKIGVTAPQINFLKAPNGQIDATVLDNASDYVDKVTEAVEAEGGDLRPYIIAHGILKTDLPVPTKKPSFWNRIFSRGS